MLEGKIIKFYRELRNMTQKELGDGICSGTHVSKIERGLTEVSNETIQFLADRLKIDIQNEMNLYRSVELLLKKWEEAIIMKLDVKTENIKKQLEQIALLQIPDFYRTHTLLLTRYYILTEQRNKAEKLLQEMERWTELSHREKSMLLHIKGIYGLQMKHDYYEAIDLLKQVDPTYYNNPEYYYHMAVAYHSTNSRVLSYYYASKALRFFEKSHCYARVIETEMLMLIQIEQEPTSGPQNEKYIELIEMCENFGLEKQKALLLHNFGYHSLLHGHFENACQYYKESMQLKDPNTSNYLGSLEGYVNAATLLGKEPITKLLQLAEKGLKTAHENGSTTFVHFFQMHIYRLKKQDDKYYYYLEKELYPHLKKLGYVLPAEHYEIILFDFHNKNSDVSRANEYAKFIADKNRRTNQFV
ncbi:helix-turn-helix domain-containing protein [Fictibacillus phosphorivorans]|uniref:helix-turn-helix domain-containing protein n=1 Tax=Fictibacillus phosphorivorans TaxID=1221500 RepID=UPI0012931BF7|nr:helix-turn-helix transcriptional regulator [Fictibacillus phosphorivorans]MQR94870.1 XRE family transcriptional regulator [Fictibacillus phosphorivorans]